MPVIEEPSNNSIAKGEFTSKIADSFIGLQGWGDLISRICKKKFAINTEIKGMQLNASIKRTCCCNKKIKAETDNLWRLERDISSGQSTHTHINLSDQKNYFICIFSCQIII